MAKGGFRGGPMGGGINANMIKQAQKMQQDMLRMQEEMENQTYEATVGGGRVKAVADGTNTAVTYKTSNTKYATVTAAGVVKAQRAGKGKTVTVTATSKGVNAKGKKVSAVLKIKIK